jgi:hypothetical protein
MDLPLDSDFGIDSAPYPSYLLDEDQIILSQPVLVLEDIFVSEVQENVPRCHDKSFEDEESGILGKESMDEKQISEWWRRIKGERKKQYIRLPWWPIKTKEIFPQRWSEN